MKHPFNQRRQKLSWINWHCAATQIFEVGGASATRQSAHLDRHWRNIRTIASHNPAVYKARAIGNYIVNGRVPLSEVDF